MELFLQLHGLRWRDAPVAYGPPKTLSNRWKRSSEKDIFGRVLLELADQSGETDALMIDLSRRMSCVRKSLCTYQQTHHNEHGGQKGGPASGPSDLLVCMDAIRVNSRGDGAVSNKTVCTALAILPDGTRHVLGQGSNDRRNRGGQAILLAVVGGRKGVPQAIGTGPLPEPQVQTCILRLLRHALSFASSKDRKAVDADAAAAALEAFQASDLAAKYPAITPNWWRAWNEVVTR